MSDDVIVVGLGLIILALVATLFVFGFVSLVPAAAALSSSGPI